MTLHQPRLETSGVFDAIFDFALVTGTGGGGIFGDDIV